MTKTKTRRCWKHLDQRQFIAATRTIVRKPTIKASLPSPVKRARVTKRTSTMAQMIFRGWTMKLSSRPCVLKFFSFFLFMISLAHYYFSSTFVCLRNSITEQRHQITMLFRMSSSQLLQRSTGSPLGMTGTVSQNKAKTRTRTRR